MSKRKVTPKKKVEETKPESPMLERDDITVTNGPLAGITFAVDTVLRALGDGSETIQYKAPNNGPACVVVHHSLNLEAKCEAVRLAFSKFFPPHIVYRGGEYWDTKSDKLLEWDKHVARFVYMATPDDQAEAL